MRGFRFSNAVVSLAVASAAFAGLAPGTVVVTSVFTNQVPEIADVDRDGLADFLLDNTFLRNEGGGIFVERALGLSGQGALNGGDAVIAVLDVNGDGRVDLLTNDRPAAPPGADRDPTMYRLYLAGPQLPYGAPIDLGRGLRPYVADVNADGLDDLVVFKWIPGDGNRGETELQALVSRGNGTFAARQPLRFPAHPQFGQTRYLLAHDLNHDGLRDLVIRTNEELVVLRGTGDGNFAPAERRYLPHFYFGGWDTKVADIDGDGHLDIALAGLRIVRVFLGDGTGRFPRFTSVTIEQQR